MDVAAMNVRIMFQKNEMVSDAIGNHENVWTDYYSCHEIGRASCRERV